MATKKLQNFFNDFLPLNYRSFRRAVSTMTANQAVVAELLRACCEEDDVKAIKLTFERVLGKPEKVLTIKRTIVRTIYPDANKKLVQPEVNTRVLDERVEMEEDKPVVVDEADAPSKLLRDMFDKVGARGREYAYAVVEGKDDFDVAEVLVANLYVIAMSGANLDAIKLLFDYLDGAVADVVRLEGENTLVIESFADIAPYEAIKGEDGVYYTEMEAVK